MAWIFFPFKSKEIGAKEREIIFNFTEIESGSFHYRTLLKSYKIELKISGGNFEEK